MEETIFMALKLSATLFLMLLNGLFVAAEFSFTKLRSTRARLRSNNRALIILGLLVLRGGLIATGLPSQHPQAHQPGQQGA